MGGDGRYGSIALVNTVGDSVRLNQLGKVHRRRVRHFRVVVGMHHAAMVGIPILNNYSEIKDI